MNRKSNIVAVLAIASILIAFGKRANADFVFGEPVNLGPEINTISADASNCTSVDHLELYFCSNRPGGFGDMDIWVSTRQSIDDPWESPVSLSSPVNSQYVEAYPSLSSDGLTLYFSDLYSGTPRPGGIGGADIWMTTRTTRSDPWKTPVNLGVPVNSSAMEISPSVSGDGLILVFASSRTGTSGPYDLWMSTRSSTQDPWDPPVNLGASVNGMYGELECSLSADGLVLFFASGRPGGLSQYDLWMTTRESRQDPWTPTVNVGPMVNGIYTEGAAGVSADMRTLYFDSDRPGGFGSWDIWAAPIIPIVDFNGDGIVDSGDMCTMVDYWGTNEPLCDIGPMPWGDGIVDVEDLKVLAKHLFQDVDDPTLIAHWPLDEAQGDIAYNSEADCDGTLMGDPVWQPEEGMVTGALQFDGIDDYVITDPVLNPADGVFSVIAWIKGDTPGQVLLSQTGAASWLCADSIEGNLMTELKSGRSSAPLLSQTRITDDTWHRIGFVWDGSCRHLYVDGIEVTTDTTPLSALASVEGGLYFGVGSDLAPGTFFSGLIDDVRIYNRAVHP